MQRIVTSAYRNRELILEMTKRELFQAHAGHMLGGVWVFFNPMVTLLIYFFIFNYIFPARLPESEGVDRGSEVFLLAGLIQWITLSEMMVRACQVIRANANLVRQINFPLEVLIFKTVASSAAIQIVMTGGLLVLMVATSGMPSALAVGLWLIAFSAQIIFMIGLTFLFASLTPFFPDFAELIGIIARLGLFAAPILYTVDRFASGALGGIFYANPFSYFAWLHQDALYWQGFSHAFAWPVAVALAVVLLWAGHRTFQHLSPGFNDVL
jgi:lipopolysaccharide transport system permease protein